MKCNPTGSQSMACTLAVCVLLFCLASVSDAGQTITSTLVPAGSAGSFGTPGSPTAESPQTSSSNLPQSNPATGLTVPPPATPPQAVDISRANPIGVASTLIQVPQAEITRIQDSLTKLDAGIADLKGSTPLKDWAPIGAAILTAVIAVFSIWKSTSTSILMTKGTLAEKAREEERKAIREKIDGFYAPFLQLRSCSKLLYHKAFIPRRSAQDLASYSDSNGNFRTLAALVGGRKFIGTDEILLDKIVSIGQQTSALIQEKVGLVSDPSLQEALATAAAHFHLMQLAFKNPDVFKDAGAEVTTFTFPHELDENVQAELNSLNDRLKALTTTSTLPE